MTHRPGLTLKFLLACAFCAASLSEAGAQDAAPATQHGVADAPVVVTFTAVDKSKRFISTLRPEDVRVSVDGKPQPAADLTRRRDLPILLAVMLDTSNSQERILPGAKHAADVFVAGVMRPGVDRAAVVTFTNDATLEQGMTGDVKKVRDAIARVQLASPSNFIILTTPPPKGTPWPGSTAMWDAVYSVSNDLFGLAPGAERRALIFLTDGEDTGSRVKSDEAIRAALRAGVAVYAVGSGDPVFGGPDKDALRKLAERTGGRAFFPKKDVELSDIFTQIRDELFSQYAVTFTPPPGWRDGSFHKIKVELVNPELRAQGVLLACPQEYFHKLAVAAAPVSR